MNTPTTSRRRFLEVSGIGGGVLLAGCSEQLSQPSQSGDFDGTVAAFASIDQERLESTQAQLRQQMMAEQIGQQEAQLQYVQVYQEVLDEGMDAINDAIAEVEDVEADEEHEDFGAVVVDGEPAAILELLESAAVNSLSSTADLEAQIEAHEAQQAQMEQQQQMQEQMEAEETTGEEGDDTDGEDSTDEADDEPTDDEDS